MRSGVEEMKRIQIKTLLKRHNAILGLIFMIILAACINKSFLTLENLTNVLRQASMNGMDCRWNDNGNYMRFD